MSSISHCLDTWLEEYIHKHPTAVHNPDFEDKLMSSLYAKYPSICFHMSCNADTLLKTVYREDVYPRRSFKTTFVTEHTQTLEYKTRVSDVLENLRQKPQHKQRSREWYEFRHGLITASSAADIFGTQSAQNRLIREKCESLPEWILSAVVDTEAEDDGTAGVGSGSPLPPLPPLPPPPPPQDISVVNINSPLQWGQRYETVSCMIYEEMFDTHVAEFGCIQHPSYSFLGASPDGINDNPLNPRYGRMLEIKNPTTRIIDGVPKREYWIQMQLQMEVCNLDETDFWETQFREFEGERDYLAFAENDIYKGMKLFFVRRADGKPRFEYMPLAIKTQTEYESWMERTMTSILDSSDEWLFIRPIYWYLAKSSCVLVPRNRVWFAANVDQMAAFWQIVERERKSGEWRETRSVRKRVSGGSVKTGNTSLWGEDACCMIGVRTSTIEAPPEEP